MFRENDPEAPKKNLSVYHHTLAFRPSSVACWQRKRFV